MMSEQSTQVSFECYLEKTEDGEINSHSIDRVLDKHGQTGWSVSGHDQDDCEFVSVLPFAGSAREVVDQLREMVGLDDEINGPYL